MPATAMLRDDMTTHIERVCTEGYTVVRNALSGPALQAMRSAFDRLIAERIAERERTDPKVKHVEIKRLCEADPAFEALMDLPTTFPVARALIGRDITLASGGEGDWRRPCTAAHISWHNDFAWMQDVAYPRTNFWIRCTYLLEDVTDDMGPFTLLPKTHLADRPCPTAELSDAVGQPRSQPGEVRITGSAGDCLINNTEIWHTNTPNRSDRPRKLMMILYKKSWMQQWGAGYELSQAFAERQTTPLRRQLCGLTPWFCAQHWVA